MAIVGGSLFIHGYEQVADRLETASSVETLDKDRGRRQIWEADCAGRGRLSPLGLRRRQPSGGLSDVHRRG